MSFLEIIGVVWDLFLFLVVLPFLFPFLVGSAP